MLEDENIDYRIPILPVRYARHFFSFMENRGISQSTLLNDSEIRSEQLQEPDAFLTMQQIVPVLKLSQALLNDDRIAFQFGQSLDLAKHGLLGYDLLYKHDVKKLITVNVDHLRLSVPLFDMEIMNTDSQCTIRLCNRWDLGRLSSFVVAIYMGSIHTLGSMIAKEMLFEMEGGHETNVERWSELVSNASFKLASGANQITLILPRKPINMAEIDVENILADFNLNDVSNNSRSGGILNRVRQEVIRNPGRDSSLDRISHQLGMTPRSVRRHLNMSGISFQELRNEIRKAIATRYLKDTTLPVGVIAERLGYSDQASFTKAYRSWTGRTPGKVRRHPSEHESALKED